MWPFTKERNKRSIDSVAKTVDDALIQLTDAHNVLVKQHNTLVEQVEDLQKAHLKLRGQYYAQFGKGEKDDAGEKPESRNELRARLVRQGRFIPGKPPVHQE